MISRSIHKSYMQDGPELYYKTRTGVKKYVHFDTLDEAFVWCKRNYKTVTPTMGSWQILHYIACFRVNGTRVYTCPTDSKFFEEQAV